jgi:enoyl-CoA hydratase
MTEQARLVKQTRDGHVATVILDSPGNRNALSSRLVAELTEALHEAEGQDDVRVIVLTHTGGTFCSGADLAEAVRDGMEHGTRVLLGLLRTVIALSKPVVAVVRGHARAGGVGLVGACDIALATHESTFAFTEVRLGLTPAIISLTTRSRLDDRVAQRLYLTGEVFDGRAAADYGLVTASVDGTGMDAELESLLGALRQVSPQGLRETKALLNEPDRARMATQGERLVELSARLFASEEAREGMQAFRERRPARWAVADSDAR